MREMLIRTPSTQLEELHRDVWRMANTYQDRGYANRTFLFRKMDSDGHIVVRGPFLPRQHSREVTEPLVGREYAYRCLVYPVKRSDYGGEAVIGPVAVPRWFRQHVSGVELLSCYPGRPQRFDRDGEHVMIGYDVHGTLRVRNIGKFRAMTAHGIGRLRAYGFGMLLLRPVHVATLRMAAA